MYSIPSLSHLIHCIVPKSIHPHQLPNPRHPHRSHPPLPPDAHQRRIRPHQPRPHPAASAQNIPANLPPPNQTNIHNPRRRPRNITDAENLPRIRMQRVDIQIDRARSRAPTRQPVDFWKVFGEVCGAEIAAPGFGVVFVRQAGGVEEGVDEFLAVGEEGEGGAGGGCVAVEGDGEGEDGEEEEEEEEWDVHGFFCFEDL